MNILYINHYAGSIEMGMEFRPYYIAKELLKYGHKVDIIAADYSHLRSKNPNVINWEITNIDGIDYHWVHTKRYKGNGIKRAITMFQFVGALKRNAKRIALTLKPDVIITSSTYPLDTYAGQKIKRIAQKRLNKKVLLIHEVHDMWPITPIELYGMSPKNPFIIMLQKAENSFCKHSDKVISILPFAKDYLIEHGMGENNFCFVPNGIVLDDWDNKIDIPVELKNVLSNARQKEKFVLCFFGSHTRSYSLDYLIKAVKQLSDNKLFVIFVGDGVYKQELIRLCDEMNLNNQVYFYDKINKKMIPGLLDYCDATYVGAIKNQMFRFGIGMNKLFDSMMGGKPILYAVDAPNNYIKEYNCGVSVEAESVDDLVNGLKTLLEMSSDELAQMGRNGKEAVIQNFNYTVIGKEIDEIITGDIN